MRRIGSARRGIALVGIAAGIALALSACVPVVPTPVPTDEPTATSEPSATPAPVPAVLDLEGTATDNLPYFNKVNRAWIKGGGATDGRSLIDNLVAAGFAKEAMEVTPDRTSINAQADQVQFSVRINGTCLIGQYGGGKYNGSAQTLLSSGHCLVGNTRRIDW
ncbi:hypothetical protein BH09ACT4_BH09ACT4_14180 [soil metagenome]